MTTPTPPTSGRQDGQYRKKPVVIEAFRMGIDPRPDWFTDKVSKNEIITHVVAGDEGGGPFAFARTWCEIKTLEGIMAGEYGDFIIQGVKGEVYPCKSEIFALTYERVRPLQPAPTATPGDAVIHSEPLDKETAGALYEMMGAAIKAFSDPKELPEIIDLVAKGRPIYKVNGSVNSEAVTEMLQRRWDKAAKYLAENLRAHIQGKEGV